jgi:hypothetical protein
MQTNKNNITADYMSHGLSWDQSITEQNRMEESRKGHNVYYLNRETDPPQNINAAVTTKGSASGSPVTIFLLH